MRYLILFALAGCLGDIDPEWQLDHTRIVAVRATPPHIPAGATSQLDMLVATKGATTSMPAPDGVIVVSPMSLAGALSGTTVTAPSEDQLRHFARVMEPSRVHAGFDGAAIVSGAGAGAPPIVTFVSTGLSAESPRNTVFVAASPAYAMPSWSGTGVPGIRPSSVRAAAS